MSRQEADALAAAIGQHFGEAIFPRSRSTRNAGTAISRMRLDLATTPLSVAIGRDIEPLMPQGDDALRFRSLLNELQMLLFEHPVNQAREARGELPINSLWLWGGGHKRPAPSSQHCRFMRVIARPVRWPHFAAQQVHPLPAQLDNTLLETEAISAAG